MMQCVAVCGSVLQYIAVCCSLVQCVAVCGSVLQYVAVCCSLVQCVAVCCIVLQCVAVFCSVLQYGSMLQCLAVCCSVLQCVSVFCSALQCDKSFVRALTNVSGGSTPPHSFMCAMTHSCVPRLIHVCHGLFMSPTVAC